MPRLSRRGILRNQPNNQQLPRKALIAVAAVVATVLLVTLLITLQESLTVALAVSVLVEVGSLRIIALPAAGIVRTRIKSVLITLIYGRLIVTVVPIASTAIVTIT